MDQNSPKFHFTTTMEKEDYKHYLNFITFRKSKTTWLSLTVIGTILCFFLCSILSLSGLGTIASVWLFSVLLSTSFLLLKINRQVNSLFGVDSIKPEKAFKAEQTVTIYETYLTASNRTKEGKTSVSYEDFNNIYESNQYLFFYFSPGLASLIRKKDIPQEQIIPLTQFLQEKLSKRYHNI